MGVVSRCIPSIGAPPPPPPPSLASASSSRVTPHRTCYLPGRVEWVHSTLFFLFFLFLNGPFQRLGLTRSAAQHTPFALNPREGSACSYSMPPLTHTPTLPSPPLSSLLQEHGAACGLLTAALSRRYSVFLMMQHSSLSQFRTLVTGLKSPTLLSSCQWVVRVRAGFRDWLAGWLACGLRTPGRSSSGVGS